MGTESTLDKTGADRRNRQPSQKKHEAILEAAVRLFSENGYAATSVDAIAAEAGVAKQTVYHLFGNKNALLEAAIRQVSAQVAEPLNEIEIARRPPVQVLTVFAERLLDLTMTPQSHCFLRFLIGEAAKTDHPTVQPLSAGMSQTQAALSRYLGDQAARGRISVEDPALAAQMFLGMLAGDLRLKGLLGILPEIDAETRDRQIRAAVGTFLRAVDPCWLSKRAVNE